MHRMCAAALLLLLAPAVASPLQDAAEPGGGALDAASALAADDECVAGDGGGCALSALQLRGEKGAKTTAGGDPAAVSAVVKPKLTEVPGRLFNNASNAVMVANCHTSLMLEPGKEITAEMHVPGGFWIIPADVMFNCKEGCADCFYVASMWTAEAGSTVRIGYGFDHNVTARDGPHPIGGGLKLSVDGADDGRAVSCWGGACDEGWRKPLHVDEETTVSVTIQGSLNTPTTEEDSDNDEAEPDDEEGETHDVSLAPDETLGVARGRIHIGRVGPRRIGRPRVHVGPIVRPGFYHPYRPIYHPVRVGYRPYRPIYYPAPVCTYCVPVTCWWLC